MLLTGAYGSATVMTATTSHRRTRSTHALHTVSAGAAATGPRRTVRVARPRLPVCSRLGAPVARRTPSTDYSQSNQPPQPLGNRDAIAAAAAAASGGTRSRRRRASGPTTGSAGGATTGSWRGRCRRSGGWRTRTAKSSCGPGAELPLAQQGDAQRRRGPGDRQ